MLDKSGLTVDITGTLEFPGEIPSDIEFELYGVIDNQDAFDYSYCGSAVSASAMVGWMPRS